MNSTPARRVVFDTNTLVSALLLPTSIPRQALDHAFDHGRVLTSLALLGELDRVLKYPKLAPFITAAERSQFLGKLTLEGTLTTITVQLTVVRDPKDNFVLELAVSGGANVIVSGDNDLITLGRYDGIPIRTPAQFLQEPEQP
jgi:putative PIN family toxin of toxin-antitoxin system